jgi:hypothetical protein
VAAECATHAIAQCDAAVDVDSVDVKEPLPRVFPSGAQSACCEVVTIEVPLPLVGVQLAVGCKLTDLSTQQEPGLRVQFGSPRDMQRLALEGQQHVDGVRSALSQDGAVQSSPGSLAASFSLPFSRGAHRVKRPKEGFWHFVAPALGKEAARGL